MLRGKTKNINEFDFLPEFNSKLKTKNLVKLNSSHSFASNLVNSSSFVFSSSKIQRNKSDF